MKGLFRKFGSEKDMFIDILEEGGIEPSKDQSQQELEYTLKDAWSSILLHTNWKETEHPYITGINDILRKGMIPMRTGYGIEGNTLDCYIAYYNIPKLYTDPKLFATIFSFDTCHVKPEELVSIERFQSSLNYWNGVPRETYRAEEYEPINLKPGGITISALRVQFQEGHFPKNGFNIDVQANCVFWPIKSIEREDNKINLIYDYSDISKAFGGHVGEDYITVNKKHLELKAEVLAARQEINVNLLSRNNSRVNLLRD